MDHHRIEWHDGLSIGNAGVDEQHRTLIERIAAIPDDAQGCPDELVDAMMEYAARHFEDEERFMREVGYPDFERHRNTHRVLVKTLVAYHDEWKRGGHDLYAFKYFTFRWVREHIMGEDRRIGEFVRRRPSQPL